MSTWIKANQRKIHIWSHQKIHQYLVGGWATYPSEKYDGLPFFLVSWDDVSIPMYEMENNKCSSHHQPVAQQFDEFLQKKNLDDPIRRRCTMKKVGFDHHHYPLVNVYITMENHHENSWVNQLFYICTHHHCVPNIAGCPIFLLPNTIIRFPDRKRPAQLGRWLRVPSYNLGKHHIVWCIPISFPR